MKCAVTMDSTPIGQFPNEIMSFDVIGAEVRQGRVEYGFDGMIGYHHSINHYFRSSAEEKQITLVFRPTKPLEASALHRLFTLQGRRVGTVLVIARRNDDSEYARLEMREATIASTKPVKVTAGTIYLVGFRAGSSTSHDDNK